MNRLSHGLGAVALSFALGCTSTGVPTTAASRDPEPPDLVGAWDIAFRLSPDSHAEQWAPDTEIHRDAVVHGRLVVSADSILWADHYVLLAQFSADFRPMLDRQVSCLADAEETWVARQDFVPTPPGPGFRIWFTPGAADCGLDAGGVFHDGVATGEWAEEHFVATTVFGDFTMTRVP